MANYFLTFNYTTFRLICSTFFAKNREINSQTKIAGGAHAHFRSRPWTRPGNQFSGQGRGLRPYPPRDLQSLGTLRDKTVVLSNHNIFSDRFFCILYSLSSLFQLIISKIVFLEQRIDNLLFDRNRHTVTNLLFTFSNKYTIIYISDFLSNILFRRAYL